MVYLNQVFVLIKKMIHVDNLLIIKFVKQINKFVKQINKFENI